MITGLTEYEKFKVVRPIIGDCQYDNNYMPIIRQTSLCKSDLENLNIIGIQNANPKTIDKHTLVVMFNYDKKLMSLWNDPLKKIGLFKGFYAVSTPDFSLYPSMNLNEIRHNIYMSRWLGVTWQNYGCLVFPTVGWANPDSYDLCFSGIEKDSIVVISTLGCQNRKLQFLDGFNEMKKRISPSLIIVYGDMIEGMTGTFINFKYTDAFSTLNQKFQQISFDFISKIFTWDKVI